MMQGAALGIAHQAQTARALLVNFQAQTLAMASEPCPDSANAADWLDATTHAVQQAMSQANLLGSQVVGIGLATPQPELASQLVEQTAPTAAPGQAIGRLSAEVAEQWRLPEGLPVSAPTLPTHAAVPGVGVAEPSTMVIVLRPGHPLLLNSRVTAGGEHFAGPLPDAILPGYLGYQVDVPELEQVLRSITQQPDAARLEQAACLIRHAAEHLRQAGVFCRRFVVGGLDGQPPELLQALANVMQERVTAHPADDPAALGAAALGAVASGRFASMSAAVHALARARPDRPACRAVIVRPDRRAAKRYEQMYANFRQTCR